MYGRDFYTFANQDAVPTAIINIIHTILKSWDQAKTDYKYISAFAPDGVLHVAPLPTQGEEALKKIHDDMINPTNGPVINLQHYLDRVYIMPGSMDGKTEAVFNGKLTSHLLNGKSVTTDFATRLILVDVNGELKAELVRIYSDTSALMSEMVRMATAAT
ncbi:uncharacterized protein A1O9_07218 [Exophiala aquamarina CBS 119918]|uniref:SnoaL-like domain-containing protein n=1 Tax=Exophiala aquamarina CBS 119918 TaxID=1182545 RepID=A0A072PCJ8_9EURO|nr:uncharacterized protein A1O9_07218 [Exophiala aquamarina CBS 119918]KEF57028.1 hypothetical protein A1O9_07218 [Exophiala aquamarina CBS 119918]